MFTGKILDEETQLYYYGARYYDARTSVWQSVDPAFRRGEYFPTGNRENDANLPGGGLFNSINLAAYTYSYQNPVKLVDPDGRLARKKNGSFFEKFIAVGSGSDWGIKLIFHKVFLYTNRGGREVEAIKRVDENKFGHLANDTNMMGWLFAEGKYKLDNNAAETILSADYNKISPESVREGDIYILRDIKTGNIDVGGKLKSYDSGILGAFKKIIGLEHKSEGESGFREIERSGENLEGWRLEFYRKAGKDRIVDE
jgi:RHS repeat-associated protein